MSELVLTAVLNGDTDYGKKLCEEVNKVSKQDVADLFKDKFSLSAGSVFVVSVN